MSVKLRFVYAPSLITRAVLARTGGLYAHVESVTPDGKYLGAHWQDGIQARPADYDKGLWARQHIVTVPATDAQETEFYAFQYRHIGEPYDYGSIFGFLAAWTSAHEAAHVICSAFQCLALRTSGVFPYALARPAHEISPRDLHLGLSFFLDIGRGETPAGPL